MLKESTSHPPERVAMLQWTARMGAVTAEALATREGWTVSSSRSRLLAAERGGLLTRQRPLAGRPSLYTVTRSGLRASGLHGLDSCRISAANAEHAIACADAAAALERCYRGHRVLGERELRRDERESGTALASAFVGYGSDGEPALHRPDLVLWPVEANEGLPVAVEVELTTKASRRLLEICRAWARSRCVDGVLYLAPHEVAHSLGRAVDKADAADRILIIPLDALLHREEVLTIPAQRTIPGDA
jgi:hypothetical protein